MTITCSYQGCTVETTGRCVLGNALEECPHRDGLPDDSESVIVIDDQDGEAEGGAVEVEGEAETAGSTAEISAPVLQAPVRDVTPLPLGGQLGFPGLLRIGGERGLRLIGILGPPEAGKTAILVSLFLLLNQGRLSRIAFRNSDTLFALSDLARGAREWDENGNRLAAITDHTSLDDPRRPGFLHFRLHAEKLGRAVDFVFPDLPGEWTNDLIDKGYDNRLDFLKSAQALWVFVDGSALIDPRRRQSAVDRTRKLLARIAKFIAPHAATPIIVVVTRRDAMEAVPEDQFDLIREEATARGLSIEILSVASISDREGIPNGYGIEDLLEASIVIPSAEPLPETAELAMPEEVHSRQMLMYRNLAR